MSHHSPHYSLFGGVLLALLGALLGGQISSPARAADLLASRDLEPVVVKGVFAGVPVGQIIVYRQTGGGLQPIPSQVDERDADDVFVASEDGLLDANDEIVFLSRDLGPQATVAPSAALPAGATYYEVAVSDPNDASRKEYAYIVHAAGQQPTTTDYVDYSATNRRIAAATYTQEYASGFAGADKLTVYTSPDILDRSKLRVRYTLFGVEQQLTEESPVFTPSPPTVIHDGTVRVILRQGSSVILAYASLVRNITTLDLSGLPNQVVIKEVRVSVDLNALASGSTYYDENTPAGVPVDGAADPVPATPAVKLWRQVSLDAGTLVQIVNVSNTGGTVERYYKDNALIDPKDTGDQRSFGDVGVVVKNPTADRITVETLQIVLPQRQPNVGTLLYDNAQSPLAIVATPRTVAGAGQRLFLPALAR